MNMHVVARTFVSADKKSVVIQGISPEVRMTVLGSSLPVSVDCEVPVPSVTIAKKEGEEEGVIGLYFHRPEWKGTNREVSVSGLFAVDWKREKPFDEEKPFFSKPGRLGQAISCDRIEVRASDKVYTSQELSHRQNYLLVPDGNLLCRFLMGLAEEKDLEAAVVAVERKAEAEVELAAERTAHAATKRELEGLTRHAGELNRSLQSQRTLLVQRSLVADKYVELLHDIYDDDTRLPFISRKRLKKRIAERNESKWTPENPVYYGKY